MLNKVNKLKNWQVFIVITCVGFVTYFDGLKNHFQGDDIPQIVNNVTVHSLSNIGQFFTSGTFYNGHNLTGVYYRPLMTTTFSLLYSLFGANAIYFHIFQLILAIASTIFLYLFFRYSFSTTLSLILSLIFLVHPVDSQTVFAIPSMQDSLFFFFGITAIYSCLRFKSMKSLMLVVLLLTLSIFSEETGIFFIFMAGILLYVWDRPKFRTYLFMIIFPLVLWFGLRMHAVHLFNNSGAAPIDYASLQTRLLTMPSVLQFYLSKLIFPVKIASGYYWIYKKFSINHVLVPLLIDLGVLGFIVYASKLVKKKATKPQYYTYLFFTTWLVLGLFSLSQIIPLDLTANTLLMYFPMVGLLGMIGVVIHTKVLQKKVNIGKPQLTSLVCLLLLAYIGLSAYQGLQWKSSDVRYYHDISVSNGNYLAYENLSSSLLQSGNYEKAKNYTIKSLAVLPDYVNYINLGAAYTGLGDYADALKAYNTASHYPDELGVAPGTLYDNVAELTLTTNKGVSYSDNRKLIERYLRVYPNDSTLWLCLALLDQKNGDNKDALNEIIEAINNSSPQQPEYASLKKDYASITTNQSFTMQLGSRTIQF